MTKLIFVLATTLMFSVGNANAHDGYYVGDNGFVDYVAADVGQISNTSGPGNGNLTAYEFDIGFARYIEIGAFGATTPPVSDGYYGTQSVTFNGATFVGHVDVPIADYVFLLGRLGVSFNSTTLNGTGSSRYLNYTGSIDTTSPLIGIGIEFMPSRNVGIRIMSQAVGNFGTSNSESVLTTVGMVFHFHS
jgi:hypothetical protein